MPIDNTWLYNYLTFAQYGLGYMILIFMYIGLNELSNNKR